MGQEDKAPILASGLLVSVGSILPSLTGGMLWIASSRIVGEEGVGLASSIISTGFMVAFLASLGLDMALVRNIRRLGASALLTGLGLALPLVLALSMLASRLISGRVPSQYTLFIYIFAISFLISFLLLWSLVGLRLPKIYAKITTVSSLVKLFLGILLALYYGPLGIIMGFIAGSLTSITMSMLILARRLDLGSLSLSKDVILDGISNYPNVLAGNIAANIGTVLAVLTSERLGDVGVFYLSLTVALLAGSFSYSLAYVAVSYGAKDKYHDITRYAILTAALAAPALASAPGLVYRVLGITGDTTIMIILAMSILGYSALYMVISILNTRVMRARLGIVGLTRVLTLIVLSLALSNYGPVGVAISYTISIYVALLASSQWHVVSTMLRSITGLAAGLAAGLITSTFSEVAALAASPLVAFIVLVATGFVSLPEISIIIKSVVNMITNRRI